MAIEKMTLVNIKGPLDRLDDAIHACSDAGCFHPKNISPDGSSATRFEVLEYQNPYLSLLSRMKSVAASAGIPLEYRETHNTDADLEKMNSFVSDFQTGLNTLLTSQTELKDNLVQYENALVHLKHLTSMNLSFDQAFSGKYFHVRFGRLPRDSEPKLAYYDNKMFLFCKFDVDDTYIWSAYFTTNEFLSEVDDIFSSLFFERVQIPDYVHGTPHTAAEQLDEQFKKDQARLEEVTRRLEALISEKKDTLIDYYSRTQFLCSTFDIRRFVGVSGGTFFMVGFIPKSDENSFSQHLNAIAGVEVSFLPADTDKRFQPPTKLKNNRFVQPFEMFVKMYGLPSHLDMDPTPYIAFVYMLLFGIMFGDLGQGILLSLIGWVLYKWKKMELGRIMERIGISSSIFGILYGSVFGFEHALDGFWRLFGFAEKPIEVMDSGMTNILLVAAVGLGAVIIAASILLNIILGIRQRDWDRAVFSQNGIAGLVFYMTVLAGVLGMFTGISVLNPVVITVGIVLPVLVMFLREPLTKISRGRHDIKPEGGIGSFIAESFFELFDVVLSFITNTMSFLRVGGFILSHAGMMAVVFSISEMVSSGAAPVAIVLGNLFVMCLEGLVVGIQALRLQFYEMFSRFFSGEGEPFEPIAVDVSADVR